MVRIPLTLARSVTGWKSSFFLVLYDLLWEFSGKKKDTEIKRLANNFYYSCMGWWILLQWSTPAHFCSEKHPSIYFHSCYVGAVNSNGFFITLWFSFFFVLTIDRESFFIDIIHSKMGVYQHFLSVIVMALQLFINDWFKKPVSSVSQVRVNSGNKGSRSQTLSLQSVSSHYLSHHKVNAADCVVLWILVFHGPRPMRGYPSQLLTSQTLLDSQFVWEVFAVWDLLYLYFGRSAGKSVMQTGNQWHSKGNN